MVHRYLGGHLRKVQTAERQSRIVVAYYVDQWGLVSESNSYSEDY